ncbi:hypothetical protein CSKR_108951 [Clonorchis sinensis]|uniref:Uncharacterized protein n=1 Tax=Clonorchis sinensis TaxID=79923 RepID=A0A419PQD3_CLOSI|nr:hypothetical protein CSKR_108951 [Clonorchis sinensis]
MGVWRNRRYFTPRLNNMAANRFTSKEKDVTPSAIVVFCRFLFSLWGEIAQRLERERTDRKVCGSNPASASRLPLSRLGQPGSIPALVLPSGGMAARHRKGATAERFLFLFSLFTLWNTLMQLTADRLRS